MTAITGVFRLSNNLRDTSLHLNPQGRIIGGMIASFGQHGLLSQRAAASSTTETAQSAGLPAAQPQDPKLAQKRRVLSGVQPTGTLHLGNYLGAIKNWVKMQELYDTFFCVVDLHAITLPHEPKDLLEATRKSAALYIASGINPDKASIFVQSHVSAHAELAWLLQCYTPIGWLRRMIQFKEKSQSQATEEVGAGLLTYPVLMAADILLYGTDLVPVGADQKQHIELARDIAERFNGKFGGKKWKKLGGRGGRLFKIPEAFMPPTGARVMSLTDGTSKMSKSAESDASRLNLLDSPDVLASKIKRAKTDAFIGLEYDNPDRPEATNLLAIYSLVTGRSTEDVVSETAQMSWGEFKPLLADAVIAHLEPLQQRYNAIMEDEGYLDSVLARGADKAEEAATRTLDNVREAMGFVPRFKR
ncbi:g4467 [Coccomyxa viridis]|uniref:tryptophan--tRNA ligase n=1 Tax=Coccomyxa viridis TaxID=1274662 RepID=A0ABP1FQC5_9CHLO